MLLNFCIFSYPQVVGYDGSTNVREFGDQLSQLVGVRAGDQSGFAIFSDDPLEKDVDHALHPDDKVCDVISRWETALREKGQGRFENNRVIRFTYKNRMYWRKNVTSEGEREKLLLCYQTIAQIVDGQFPLNKELALELAALMAQIHFGDLSAPPPQPLLEEKGAAVSATHLSAEVVERFFPSRYLESVSKEDRTEYEKSVAEKWISLRGKSALDCVRIFLTCTRKWQFFGARLFEVQVGDRFDIYLFAF